MFLPMREKELEKLLTIQVVCVWLRSHRWLPEFVKGEKRACNFRVEVGRQ